jgi:Bardet-Biedl syndrome 7 protein
LHATVDELLFQTISELSAQEVYMEAVPTAISYFSVSHDVLNQHPTRKEVFVGLSDGSLHQLFLDSSSHHFGTTLSAPSGQSAAAISQVYSGFDSAQDGLDDLVIGRDDGKIEIYRMDSFGQLLKVWFL